MIFFDVKHYRGSRIKTQKRSLVFARFKNDRIALTDTVGFPVCNGSCADQRGTVISAAGKYFACHAADRAFTVSSGNPYPLRISGQYFTEVFGP